MFLSVFCVFLSAISFASVLCPYTVIAVRSPLPLHSSGFHLFCQLSLTLVMMPPAISSQLFYSIRDSPLLLHLLPKQTLLIIRGLGISSRPPTKRGKHSGKSHRIRQSAKKFVFCGLVNARSLLSNMLIVQDHINFHQLDMLAITESWLTVENGDEVLRSATPPGYSFVHKPRVGRRGGGLACIFRSTIKCLLASIDLTATTFEFLPISATTNSACLLIVIIYRPPSSNFKSFISEFSSFLELVATAAGKLIIVGDFNIHIDNSLSPVSRQFLSLIDSFDISQHVREPTHILGHSLDLVLSRTRDSVIVNCYVADPVSDHLSVHWFIKAHRPSRPSRSV